MLLASLALADSDDARAVFACFLCCRSAAFTGFDVGDVMIIADHIGFPAMAGTHPLVGPNDDRFGPRFPPVTNTYNTGLQAIVEACAKEQG